MTAILCAVPTYKNQLTGTTMLTTHALASALRHHGIDWGITAISNPDVEWVRNWFLTHWYDTMPQYSHLLMVDDDNGFLPDLVLDMLAFGEPVVGGLYPKKMMQREWAVSGLPNPEFRGPFIEVEGLGCGCFLIRRDAITTMLEKMPELIDTRPHTIDSALFRDTGVKRLIRAFDKINDPNRGSVSEDISFGRRWRDCGGKVWAATHHKMVHVGPHEFADTYSEWAAGEKQRRYEVVKQKIEGSQFLKDNPVLKGKGCKHGIFFYNPNDTFIGRSMEAYGEWSEFEIDLLKRFLRDGDTIFDVGANIGTHTIPLAKAIGKHGKVFAFEAQPRIEQILAANLAANELANVFWDCKAVGDKVCQISMSPIPADTVECNFGNFSLTNNMFGESYAADMVTIDSFATDLSPSIIKIDVEGMEADVIRGAKETILRAKPVLYLDFGDREDSSDIDQALEDISYVAFWSMGPFFNPLNAFRNNQNIWQSHTIAANLLCLDAKSVEDGKYPQVKDMQRYGGPGDSWREAINRLREQRQMALQQAAE